MKLKAPKLSGDKIRGFGSLLRIHVLIADMIMADAFYPLQKT